MMVAPELDCVAGDEELVVAAAGVAVEFEVELLDPPGGPAAIAEAQITATAGAIPSAVLVSVVLNERCRVHTSNLARRTV